MKNFSKIAIICICLLFTAIFTSACGSSKTTPPQPFPYWLLTQNNQQQNNNQNNNNEEEPVVTTEVTLTLTDSLNADKIASADIFYSVDSTTKKSSADDKEISKAEPNADDKTKFTITVNGTAENTKIKAVITYNSNGECLDYFSSYDGVEGTNGTYDIDFGNSTDNKAGFASGSGTEDDPYIISAPRHFVNINKQDDQGKYLYLDKSFQQKEDIDFSHLTGLKIVSATDDKDITVEKTNEKAPFYNEGHGIMSIGSSLSFDEAINNYLNSNTNNNSQEVLFTILSILTNPESYKTFFKGNYDGNNFIIDGIHIINSNEKCIGLFISYNNNLKNIKIGENSIIFLEELSNIETVYISSLSARAVNANIENCTNSCKIIIKNSKIKNVNIAGISNIINISNTNSSSDNSNSAEYNYINCINNANINVYNNDINSISVSGVFDFFMISKDNQYIDKCTNNGIIKITKNKSSDNNSSSKLYVSGSIIVQQPNSL